MSFLLLTVRLLDDRYHGLLKDGGPPEWPPSPFRLFCALVAGLARRGELEGDAGKALAWLQTLDPPIIVTPKAKRGQAITRYVPNNDGDKWPDRQDRLGTKPTILTLLLLPPNQNPEIHYLWKICETSDVPFEHIRTAARSVTALGWGVDMAFADARLVTKEDDVGKLKGVRWSPRPGLSMDEGMLRVPTVDADLDECTLSDLKRCHETAMHRIGLGQPLRSVDKPRVFERVFYTVEPPLRCWAAFGILKHDASAYRQFEPLHQTRDVAGMVRSCVARLAKEMRPFGWSDEQINVFVHGKTPDGQHPASGKSSPDRFLYLPLPTINPKLRRVESIRRVLIAAPAHCGEQVAWLRRTAAGAELRNDQGETAALLTILPGSDWVLRQYVEPSMNWSTVTPVILPIHDGYDADTAGEWLRTAFEQAGYAPELLSRTELDWRRVGFRAGVDLASRYLPPKNLENKPRYHVRVRFPHPIAGPLVVGSGRFRGFGLFARMDEQDQERTR